MTALLAILSFIRAIIDPVARIGGKIADLKIEQTKAQTDRERIAAEERIKGLEARRAIMVAEAGAGIKINAYVRAFMGVGVALYLNKIFIWDKVLKMGSTDPLDENLWKVVAVVIGFYFVSGALERWKR